jgi:hypothetical protein
LSSCKLKFAIREVPNSFALPFDYKATPNERLEEKILIKEDTSNSDILSLAERAEAASRHARDLED